MEKSVIISIQGTQTDPDGSKEQIELLTHGCLAGDQDVGYCLSYQESKLTGLDGTTTTFLIADDHISMLRSGSLNSEMVFREGQRHISLYDTGFGDLTVGVNTEKARSTIGGNGGQMELSYVIDVEDTIIGKNVFLIEVKDQSSKSL